MTSTIEHIKEMEGHVEPSILTIESIYNLIGTYIRDIVKLEEEIPMLEDRLRNMPDDFQGDREGVSMSLAEKRSQLRELKSNVRHLRIGLLNRFEQELKMLDNVDRREIADEAVVLDLISSLQKEVNTLKRILADESAS